MARRRTARGMLPVLSAAGAALLAAACSGRGQWFPALRDREGYYLRNPPRGDTPEERALNNMWDPYRLRR